MCAIEGYYDEIVLDFENKYEIPKMEHDLKMEIKTEIEEIDSIDPSTLNYAMDQEKLFDALQSFESTQGTKMNNERNDSDQVN